MISGDGEGRAFFWDWKTTKIFRSFKAHEGVCIGIEWHPLESSKVRRPSHAPVPNRRCRTVTVCSGCAQCDHLDECVAVHYRSGEVRSRSRVISLCLSACFTASTLRCRSPLAAGMGPSSTGIEEAADSRH